MTQTILDFVASHPFAAFALVFFVSLGEALFIVGLFVPSTFVLIAVGALVGAGKLPFLPVLALASAGAFVGDALSFWVGHHYKGRLRSVWPFRRYAALLDKGEAFFQRHGSKSIFIGRFVPGVKAIVPGIAGMVRMDFTRFSVVNITSAVVWAAAHLVPAAGLGLSLSRIHTFDPRLAVLGIVALGLVLVVYYLAKIAYGFAYPMFDRWRLERASCRTGRQGRLARFETRFLTNDRGIVGWTLVLLVAALAAGGFLTLLTDLLFDPQLKLVDKAVYNVLQSLRSEAGTRVMTALTMGAGGAVLTPLTLALLAVLLFRRRFVLAIMTGVAIGTQSVFVPVIKDIIERPRPMALYSGASSFSFPSGHATQSMTVFGVLAVIVATNLSPRWRPLVFVVAIIGALTVAFTRLYLGAHWLSDVSAGLCFGLVLTAIFAFVSRRRDKAVGLLSLAAVLIPVYAIAYGIHLYRDYDRWVGNYTPTVTVEPMTETDWVATGWRKLARHRLAIDGDTGERLFVQTDLSPKDLTARLVDASFKPIPVGSLVETLFPSSQSLSDRPTAPLMHEGAKPVLSFVLPGGIGERLVLRFWNSAYEIGPGGDGPRILIGGLSQERLQPLVRGYAMLDVDETAGLDQSKAVAAIVPAERNPLVAKNGLLLILSTGKSVANAWPAAVETP